MKKLLVAALFAVVAQGAFARVSGSGVVLSNHGCASDEHYVAGDGCIKDGLQGLTQSALSKRFDACRAAKKQWIWESYGKSGYCVNSGMMG